MEDIKEKTADEKFSELGYKQVENEELVWYQKKINNTFYDIIFNLNKKNISFEISFYNENGTLLKKEGTIELKELQAINKKCKELRMDLVEKKNKVYTATGDEDYGCIYIAAKNGKEIYEGDILKQKELIRVVKLEMSCGSCCSQVIGFGASGTGHSDFIDLSETDSIEIIGNIYDNPDLLKEE